ncbi:hypothetical protein [Salinicola halophyticus]|uniref:hypothetical protein n=1 Tax=Salinicola halophyticus TaxID=1808881 RepID=UPI003F474E8D
MARHDEFKRFDIRTRNKLRAILSAKDDNTIKRLAKFRSTLGKGQLEALETILRSSALARAAKRSNPFPKTPPFFDSLYIHRDADLGALLSFIEASSRTHIKQLKQLAISLQKIDALYAAKDLAACRECIVETLDKNGWSHALLRRIILIRENLGQDCVDEHIEKLVLQAGIKGEVVSSLIHAYARDQNILMIKRSILNIADRGSINRYTRTLSKLTVKPFANSVQDFGGYLREVLKCSLIDALILAKFNSHLFRIGDFPIIEEVAQLLGKSELFEPIVATYNCMGSLGEYAFFKQSSAWLEYGQVRQYRILTDNYYDASNEQARMLNAELEKILKGWIGGATPHELVDGSQFTNHSYPVLAKLELSGAVTRSAIFNYWLTESEGQIGFEKQDLLNLMGLTRDLARTVPIKAVRTAAKLAKDELVKLILLLLLAKRSKNELDSFLLRKILEDIAFKYHNGSLVRLVQAYEMSHPYVAEYIYDVATEDFLAKLTKLAPHRADIPEIRASLHEWMARFTNDEYFLQRARAVRIDHQINRVRNEIDDHRIYVDPSRFSSWIEDEMMIELSSALTSTGSGKKGVSVTCDETIITLVMTQSYNAFCSNGVFGIASYIGRRIRHGTFHGHVYSSVVNSIEKSDRYNSLFANSQFLTKWNLWKEAYNSAVEKIIAERLHVYSKAKPLGLLTPEAYSPSKQEVLASAVTNISNSFAETTSTDDLCPTIIDYCWRLAELDLIVLIRYLKDQQTPLKNEKFLVEELVPAAAAVNSRLADTFRRELELSIDRKLSTMLGWFKRPSIVAPQASVALIFAATVAEVQDTIPDFDPQSGDDSTEEIELVGSFYHLIYDSLAIVVRNAAQYADRSRPLRRKFEIVPGKQKRLIIEICSSIKSADHPDDVSADIEARKGVGFQDANSYDKKSGISKLLLLASNRQDFELDQYEVVGNEVHARLVYALEH